MVLVLLAISDTGYRRQLHRVSHN